MLYFLLRQRFSLPKIFLIGFLFLLGSASAQSAEEVNLNPEVSGEVEFWHFWGSPSSRTAVRRVIALCEEQLPNITVSEVFKPWGDIWTANIAAVSAGSGMPDVIISDRPKLPSEAAEGIFQSLQPYIERDGVRADAFWPFTWQQTLYDGESYGVPFETDVRVLYYNKTLFEAAGLDPESPPETWDELKTAADALDVEQDGNLERIAIDPLIGNGPPLIWVINNGYTWMQDGKPVVDAPKVIETFDWLESWIERYGGYDALTRFEASFGAPPNDYFMSGRVAMIVQTAGYNAVLNFYRPEVTIDGEEETLEWGVAPIPHNEGASSTSDSGGFSLSIPTGAENPDAAWEFIKCMSGDEAQISWARDTYAIPTRIDAARSPELTADENWDFFIDIIQEVNPNNVTFVPEFPNWKDETLGRMYDELWRGDVTVEQGLGQAQQEINQTLGE